MKKLNGKTTPRPSPKQFHVRQREIIKTSAPRNVAQTHKKCIYERKHRRTQPSQIHPRTFPT